MPNFAQLAQPTFINRMILIFIFWNTYKNFALRWRDTSIRHKFYMINTDNIERGKGRYEKKVLYYSRNSYSTYNSVVIDSLTEKLWIL